MINSNEWKTRLGSWTISKCVYMERGFPHTNNKQCSRHQLGVTQIQLSLTLFTWRCISSSRLPPLSLLQTPAANPSCYLYSDQLATDLEVLITSFLDFRHQSQVQVVTCTSDPPAINRRFPRPCPHIQLIC